MTNIPEVPIRRIQLKTLVGAAIRQSGALKAEQVAALNRVAAGATKVTVGEFLPSPGMPGCPSTLAGIGASGVFNFSVFDKEADALTGRFGGQYNLVVEDD